MNELRAEEIKETFKAMRKNHRDLMKYFQEEHLDKIESLEEDEYFNMKSWLKEYGRMIKILQSFLVNFEDYGHEEECPDQDSLIKQAVTITMLLNMHYYPKVVDAAGGFNVLDSAQLSNDS